MMGSGLSLPSWLRLRRLGAKSFQFSDSGLRAEGLGAYGTGLPDAYLYCCNGHPAASCLITTILIRVVINLE